MMEEFPSPKSGVSFKHNYNEEIKKSMLELGFRPLKAGLVLNLKNYPWIYKDVYIMFPSPKSGVSFKQGSIKELMAVNTASFRPLKAGLVLNTDPYNFQLQDPKFPSPKSGVSFKLAIINMDYILISIT